MKYAWFQYEYILINIVCFTQYFLILNKYQTINIHWDCYHTVLIVFFCLPRDY